jgi:hypothetical protein
MRNSKFEIQNLDCEIQNLDCDIQNSSAKFKTRVQNSKLDCEIQNSTVKFKTRLRNSKLDYEIQNLADPMKMLLNAPYKVTRLEKMVARISVAEDRYTFAIGSFSLENLGKG